MPVVFRPTTFSAQRAVSCPVSGLPPHLAKPPIAAVHVKQASWWSNTCAFVRKHPITLACAALAVPLIAAGAASLRQFVEVQMRDAVVLRNHEMFHNIWKYDESCESWWNLNAQSSTASDRHCHIMTIEKEKTEKFLSQFKGSSVYYNHPMLCRETEKGESCSDGEIKIVKGEESQIIRIEEIRKLLNKDDEQPVTSTDLQSIGFTCDEQREVKIQTLDLGQGKRAVTYTKQEEWYPGTYPDGTYPHLTRLYLFEGKKGEHFCIVVSKADATRYHLPVEYTTCTSPNQITRTGGHMSMNWLTDHAKNIFRSLGAECHSWPNSMEGHVHNVTCDTEANWYTG